MVLVVAPAVWSVGAPACFPEEGCIRHFRKLAVLFRNLALSTATSRLYDCHIMFLPGPQCLPKVARLKLANSLCWEVVENLNSIRAEKRLSTYADNA
jgi:hypothetical protein